MKYFTISPCPSLAAFVRFFWVLEMDTPPGAEYVYRSMADGGTELIFHYQGTFVEQAKDGTVPQAYSLIHAQSAAFRRFVTGENFGIFGVYLYPYAIPALIRQPAYEASNQLIGLADALGAIGKEIEERILLAPDTSARVSILSAFLEDRLLKKPLKDTAILSAIRYVTHAPQTVAVRDIAGVNPFGGRSGRRHDSTVVWPTVWQLAERFNLSTRQFERKFKEYAGFSPKVFSRIIRFQAALKAYRSTQRKSLTEIAYACGYYDQPHFIHEFKHFSGYHPKQYFSGRAEGIEFREV